MCQVESDSHALATCSSEHSFANPMDGMHALGSCHCSHRLLCNCLLKHRRELLRGPYFIH